MANLALLREAQTQLEAAVAKTQDPIVRKRIAWLKRGFTFTTAIGNAFDANRRDPDGPGRLEALINATQAVEKAYGPVADDPAYRHTYDQRGRRFDRWFWNWFKQPVLAAAQAMLGESAQTDARVPRFRPPCPGEYRRVGHESP